MVARKESGKVPTHPYKTARREAAQSRKTVPVKDMDNALVVAQIERLDDRLGKNQGATRERARLTARFLATLPKKK